MSEKPNYKEQISRFILQRSPRERALLFASAGVLAILLLYSFVISPTQEAFAKQAEERKSVDNTFTVAPDILTRYGKLVSRRKEIEQFYEKVDLRSDPLSHLERLLRETAKVPSGAYSVSNRDGGQLGGKYMHKVFVVKFETTSLANLASFLKDLTTGSQPMLLSTINLEKRLSGDILQVQLEVSGFEIISK